MAGIFSLALRRFPRNILNVTSQVKTFQRGCVILREHKVQTKPEVNARPQLFSLNISRNFKTTSNLLEVKIVVVPPFAESVADGDVKWQKQKGDQVVEDEVVAEIETDKTSVPVPAPGAGIIEELLVEEDATVKSGTPLFKIKITGK